MDSGKKLMASMIEISPADRVGAYRIRPPSVSGGDESPFIEDVSVRLKNFPPSHHPAPAPGGAFGGRMLLRPTRDNKKRKTNNKEVRCPAKLPGLGEALIFFSLPFLASRQEKEEGAQDNALANRITAPTFRIDNNDAPHPPRPARPHRRGQDGAQPATGRTPRQPHPLG